MFSRLASQSTERTSERRASGCSYCILPRSGLLNAGAVQAVMFPHLRLGSGLSATGPGSILVARRSAG